MRNESRYYNKKKFRSSQKRQCLRYWFFWGLFLYLEFEKNNRVILKKVIIGIR
jgi:hypothetical protein